MSEYRIVALQSLTGIIPHPALRERHGTETLFIGQSPTNRIGQLIAAARVAILRAIPGMATTPKGDALETFAASGAPAPCTPVIKTWVIRSNQIIDQVVLLCMCCWREGERGTYTY